MPDPNPSERLAEIEARVEAATAGPWKWHDFVESWGQVQKRRLVSGTARSEMYPGVPKSVISLTPAFEQHDHEAREIPRFWHGLDADLDFIAHAREDIPWLLEREKKLREALAAYRSALRSGEVETRRLREFGDAALADSGEAGGEAG